MRMEHTSTWQYKTAQTASQTRYKLNHTINLGLSSQTQSKWSYQVTRVWISATATTISNAKYDHQTANPMLRVTQGIALWKESKMGLSKSFKTSVHTQTECKLNKIKSKLATDRSSASRASENKAKSNPKTGTITATTISRNLQQNSIYIRQSKAGKFNRMALEHEEKSVHTNQLAEINKSMQQSSIRWIWFVVPDTQYTQQQRIIIITNAIE